MEMKRIIMVVALTLVVLLGLLMACERRTNSLTTPSGSVAPFAYPTFTRSPLSGSNQEAAYAAAQATLAAGQNEMHDLSQQGTMVSQNMAQAANAAAQATLDTNQRRLMELSIQGTQISQNMAQAAATQQFIAEQTQMVWNATANAQSQAATATYSAYIFNVTQTAQAQAVLDVQITHVAQANATLTAYSLTATPWAAIQAEIVRAQNESDRRALWDEFIITPLRVILFTVVVVLLIVGGVLAYQRLMPLLELRLSTIARANDNPLLLMDGVIVDPDASRRRLTQQDLQLLNPPPFPSDGTPEVEIVSPSEPSVANWISEAEQKLRSAGRMQP